MGLVTTRSSLFKDQKIVYGLWQFLEEVFIVVNCLNSLNTF